MIQVESVNNYFPEKSALWFGARVILLADDDRASSLRRATVAGGHQGAFKLMEKCRGIILARNWRVLKRGQFLTLHTPPQFLNFNFLNFPYFPRLSSTVV